MQQIRQVEGLFLNLHLAAFDAAHVQHVVDKARQVLAGGADLPQILIDKLLVVQVRVRQGGEADDGVHGRPDVVGHAVEELGLCPVGMLGGGQRGGEHLIFLALRLHHFVHVLEGHDEIIAVCGAVCVKLTW